MSAGRPERFSFRRDNVMTARLAVIYAFILCFAASPAHALCSDWLAGPLDNGQAPNGADNTVKCWTTWDPDGAGPQPALLVAGGAFHSVEGVPANYVAARDPVTGHWQALGGGTNNQVFCLAVYNGELIAGGEFTQADGQSASYIARWNGTSWQSLGIGVGNEVHALFVHNGELIAAGYFTSAGGGAANHIARWNGSSWQPLGAGIGDWVLSLVDYNGDLIAGGYFVTAGGAPANHIARWDGSSWYALGVGTNNTVANLAVYFGEVIAGGFFTQAGGLPAAYIARWNGASWSALGSGLGYATQALSVYNSELIAGGAFTSAGGSPVGYIARWNGASWQTLGSGADGSVLSLWVNGSELVAGGGFSNAGGLPASEMARWNGQEWASFGGGTVSAVLAMTTYLGHLVAGGDFHQSTLTGQPAHALASWNGVGLSPFGTGMDGQVNALKSFKYSGLSGDYELLAGGYFTHAGGIAANRIARWDVDPFTVFPPPAWQAMGSGFDQAVLAIERHSNATYAGGVFTHSGATTVNYIARWSSTGSVWEALGSGMNGVVYALKSYGGYLYAGGSFTSAGGVATGGLARWDGSGWSQVGGYFGGTVYALEVHDGVLVMAGSFPGFGGSPNLSSFNGSFYVNLGSGGTNASVLALHSTGSRLYVGGAFSTAGGVSAGHVAYWDGTWHAVAGGVDANVNALGDLGGEAQVGGAFTIASGGSPIVSRGWARFAQTGAPWIAIEPFNRTVDPGAVAVFSAEPASGYAGLSYQWLREGVPLANGSAIGGSTISGATTTTLSISNVSAYDVGNYRMALVNSCGTDTSVAVTLNLSGVTGAPRPDAPWATVFEAIGPNPTSGAARLMFSLARDSDVRVVVHDVMGRRVRALELGVLPAGRHQAAWNTLAGDGQAVRAGLYFVALEVNGRAIAVKRLTVVR
jgi:trimeric autotransporter adhesin